MDIQSEVMMASAWAVHSVMMLVPDLGNLKGLTKEPTREAQTELMSGDN